MVLPLNRALGKVITVTSDHPFLVRIPSCAFVDLEFGTVGINTACLKQAEAMDDQPSTLP